MSASAARSPLPEYTNPPVVETILGVQFDRLPGFTNGHTGAFWSTLDPAEWPSVADAPPLDPQYERFDEPVRWITGLKIQLTQLPVSRLQIKNQAGDRMIQVQNGRLHFNWLGESGGEYPRYEVVESGFVAALEHFVNFIAQARVGRFQPNQWEVTYINHVPQGTVWNSPSDWRFFQPLGQLPTIPGVALGESFAGEWHFALPEQRGRLHIEWQHGSQAPRDSDSEREMVRLTLTARGPLEPKEGGVPAICDGLRLGRETIVRAFTQLMSSDAKQAWGLKHATG